MRVLFLDIDGVLNDQPYLNVKEQEWPHSHINPKDVAWLN